jgi:type II secretory pathway pseudopilin PulG
VKSKFFSGQLGFTLVEILIGAVLLAGVALSIAQLFKDQKFTQAKISQDTDLNRYHNALAATMMRAANCNSTLNEVFNDGDEIFSQEIDELFICVPSDSNSCADSNDETDLSFDAYTPGAYVGERFIGVEDFIDPKRVWMIERMEILTDTAVSNLVNLRITYRKNENLPNSYSISKDIQLPVRLTGGAFRECLDPQERNINNLNKEMCDVFNSGLTATSGRIAVWNDVTQVCEVDKIFDCPVGQQLSAPDETGEVKCVPVINAGDADILVDETETTCAEGIIPKLEKSGKKVKVVCETVACVYVEYCSLLSIKLNCHTTCAVDASAMWPIYPLVEGPGADGFRYSPDDIDTTEAYCNPYFSSCPCGGARCVEKKVTACITPAEAARYWTPTDIPFNSVACDASGL